MEMDELNDETPKLAEAVGVSKTHFKGGETQYKNSTIIAFPHHRTTAPPHPRNSKMVSAQNPSMAS